jgi:hypothetical protein
MRAPGNKASRFWGKVDIQHIDKCWNWKGYINSDGYGNFSVDGKRRWHAHRVAYILTFGDVPEGIKVCHKCDNPSCANPNHLFLGTQKDNVQDAVRKGRMGTRKLTKEEKDYIKKSSKVAKELAIELGVSGAAIRHYR